MVYDARGNLKIYPDPVLTRISVGWQADFQLIADEILPPVRVPTRAGKYYVFGLEAFQLPAQGSLRAPGARAKQVRGISVSSDAYFCNEHALEADVTDEEEEEYRGEPDFNAFRDATNLTTEKLALTREIAARDLVMNTANYPASHVVTLSGTQQFNDHANSDPIAVFRDAFREFHKKMFREPNLAIIPYEVALELEDHPKFIDRIAHTERGILTMDLIASVLGIQRVLVPGSGYVSTVKAKEQPHEPSDVQYIWGKDIWLGWVPPNPGRRVPAFGYQFFYPIGGRIQVADRWYERERATSVVRTRRRYDLKLVTKDNAGKALAGYIIKNAVA